MPPTTAERADARRRARAVTVHRAEDYYRACAAGQLVLSVAAAVFTTLARYGWRNGALVAVVGDSEWILLAVVLSEALDDAVRAVRVRRWERANAGLVQVVRLVS